MPYNSSAFEKQLAKYKAAQAVKAVADMPDPHKAQSRVAAAAGAIKPNVTDDDTRMPVLRKDQMLGVDGQQAIIIVQRKKPLILRGWFLFLLTSVLSVAAIPVFFKEEMQGLIGMAENIKTTTGVDPLSISTYKNMMKGNPVTPGAQPNAAPAPALPANSALTSMPMPENPMDMNAVMEQVQERTNAVTTQGADQSMRYIEEETRRLNEMAREIDQQYGR